VAPIEAPENGTTKLGLQPVVVVAIVGLPDTYATFPDAGAGPQKVFAF
jgi:hypothetical protein